MEYIIKLIKTILKNKSDRGNEVEKLIRFIALELDYSTIEENHTKYLIDFIDSLNYYVQNPVHRREDLSYFGDEKLEQILLETLTNLEGGDVS